MSHQSYIYIQPPPKNVGAWKMPGTEAYFHAIKRPSWLHRTMMRLLLGWVWRDSK